MGNPQKGEVSFEAGGKTYIFRLGTYAQSVLEGRTKQSFFKFIQRKDDEWTVSDMLSVFYSGLFQKHQMTEQDVAALIDEIGPARTGEIIAEALQLAFGSESTPSENPTTPLPKLVHGSGTK